MPRIYRDMRGRGCRGGGVVCVGGGVGVTGCKAVPVIKSDHYTQSKENSKLPKSYVLRRTRCDRIESLTYLTFKDWPLLHYSPNDL